MTASRDSKKNSEWGELGGSSDFGVTHRNLLGSVAHGVAIPAFAEQEDGRLQIDSSDPVRV